MNGEPHTEHPTDPQGAQYAGGPGPGGSAFPRPEKVDPITGLDLVAWFFAQTQKDHSFYPLHKSTITFFNVMNFKTINQRFSYQGGNAYLCKFRDELKRLFEGETVLRAGADHLVVISLNLSPEEIAMRVAMLNKVMGNYEGGASESNQGGNLHCRRDPTETHHYDGQGIACLPRSSRNFQQGLLRLRRRTQE